MANLMEKPLTDHLKAFILPMFMLVVLPAGINLLEYRLFSKPVVTNQIPLLLTGAVVGLAGGALLAASIRLIIVQANTTIMPWDPSEKLVVSGPYSYVRNPMILGVILVMAAEGLILESYGILGMALLFFLGNTVYFILSEEPHLAQRFGEEYQAYRRHVRRWLPRTTSWKPEEIDRDP